MPQFARGIVILYQQYLGSKQGEVLYQGSSLIAPVCPTDLEEKTVLGCERHVAENLVYRNIWTNLLLSSIISTVLQKY